MPGPTNGIMGEEYGTEFPETAVPREELTAEKNAAKFSQSAEFQLLKQHLEGRISHYQTFLPDGTAVTNLTAQDLVEVGQKWVVANAIVAEFKGVLQAYEDAAEAVKTAGQRGEL